MKIAVLDADTLGADVSLAPLAACGELTVYGTTKPEELLDRIRDVDVHRSKRGVKILAHGSPRSREINTPTRVKSSNPRSLSSYALLWGSEVEL